MKTSIECKDPLVGKAADYFYTLELRPDIIAWLISLTNGNDVSEKSFFETKSIVDSIYQKNPSVRNLLKVFKSYFLLGDSKLPNCFDAELIKKERIANIPEYFDKEDGIIQMYMLPLLEKIRKLAKTDEQYGNAYNSCKTENKSTHSIKKRIQAYMSYVDFRTELISEMEGITIGNDDKVVLPALAWGKNIYNALYSLYHKVGYEGIINDIPKYKENQNIAMVFLQIAINNEDATLINTIFSNYNTLETLEKLLEIFNYKQNSDSLIYNGFYNEYFEKDGIENRWLCDYTKFKITEKQKSKTLCVFFITILKDKTNDGNMELVKFFIPMLSRNKQFETCRFLENIYYYLTKKQKERLLHFIVKKSNTFPFNELLQDKRFESFEHGILGNYSFDLITKLIIPYDIKNEKLIQSYLNRFYENCSISNEYVTEYFSSLHCINFLLEEEKRHEEQKFINEQKPNILTLANILLNADTVENIKKAGQDIIHSSDKKYDTPSNNELKNIVSISFEKTMNESNNLYLEMIRLSWFHTALKNICDSVFENDETANGKMLDRCRRIMSDLRKLAASEGENEQQKLALEASQYAFCFIRDNAGYWKALKPYILALRTAKEPEVTSSLKCKPNTIAGEIARRMNHREDDENSKKLRQDIANDFTEFLKPIPTKDKGDPKDRLQNYSKNEQSLHGFDISRREPNALWRYAYVRALVDLGIDNDGKGHFFHSVLDKLAQSDKSQMVRDAAENASKELKNLRGGYSSGSTKRHLMQAFWWLRRAHLQTLGIEINEKEALKERVTEYR